MYTFACSQRTVDIEEDFDGLFGDELSELICQDPAYINWLEPKHFYKMNGFDIVSVLILHKHLIGHFYQRLVNPRVTSKEDWDYLIKVHPKFEILTPYASIDIKEILEKV